ncbi:MAG: hypothetical protein KIT27_11655 [Legionellales bacterium]|nr:hypothetical protein [Legionellales bacterium]
MTTDKTELETNETKKSTFLTDESFDLLRDAQKQLQDKTGFSPTLKILINDVVNSESVNRAIERFQQKLTSIE